MSDIYVFSPDEESNDYSTMGLVGALEPTSCTFSEQANGESTVNLTHPIDDFGKYTALEQGYILRVPVPVRTTPEIEIPEGADDGEIITTVWTYRVKPKEQLTSARQRTLFKKKTGDGKIKVMKPGDTVTVVKKPLDTSGDDYRWKAKTKYGTGWIYPEGFDLVTEHIIEDNSNSIEEVESPWTVKDQLFRIYEVTKNLDNVEVVARHISYDLLYNLTTLRSASSLKLQKALTASLTGCIVPHDFQAYTNVGDALPGLDYLGRNPMDLFLNADDGLCTKFNVGMVRDNYELYFFKDPGINRGIRIEYGKNLTGVSFKSSEDDVITRIFPVGQDEDGKELYLTDTLPSYSTPGQDIFADVCVDSENKGLYPVVRTYRLDCENCKVGDKDEHGSEITKEIARARMRAQAEKLYTDEHVDEPRIEMSVEFVNLGDTEEYSQYRNLENCFLFDYILVYHPDLNINVTARISGIEWDCLLERMTSVEIGAVGVTLANVGIATWQVPRGFSGSKIGWGTIGPGQIGDDIINARHIRAGTITADLIAAGTITANEIKAGTITADKIDTEELNASVINATTAHIQALIAGTIETDELYAGLAQIAVAAIGDLSADMAAIASAVIGTATITTAQIANLSAEVANIVSANIDNLVADIIDVEALTAEIARIADAEIGNAVIDSAQIDQLTAAVVEAISLEAAQATFDSATVQNFIANLMDVSTTNAGLITVNNLLVTNANMVNAVIGELVLKGSDNKYYKLNVGSDGKITTEEVAVTDGEIEDGETSDGLPIIATNANVVNLNAQYIGAQQAIISNILTTSLEAGAITAQEALLASATIPQLYTTAIRAIGNSIDISANQSITTIAGNLSTLTTAVSGITARVQNMKIGAANLLWIGDDHLSMTNVNAVIRSGFTPTSYTRGGALFRLNKPDGGFTSSNYSVINLKDLKMNGSVASPEKLTLSFYAWTQSITGTQPKLSLLMYRPPATGVESVTQAIVANIEPPANAPGARREYTFELPYSGTFYLQLLLHGNANSFTAGSVYVSDIMLERGTMATDFCLNAEEFEDRLKTAELKVTPDSIVGTVRDGVNSSTNTQLADAIISKVTTSQTYTNDLGQKASLSSVTSLETTVNGIAGRVSTIESQQNGGTNLVSIADQRFGGSSGGDISGNNVFENTVQYAYCMSKKIFRMSGAYTGDYNILAFNNIVIKENQKYVLTYFSRIDSVTGNFPKLRIDLYNADHNQYIDGTNAGYQYTSGNTSYAKYTFKFTAAYSGTFALRFLFLAANRNNWSNGLINFSDVKLEEGTEPTSWTPSPYEMDARMSAAELKITDSSIVSTVLESAAYGSDKNTLTQSIISQTATQIEMSVDGVSVGCDNLVKLADGTVSVSVGSIASYSGNTYYRKCGKEFRLTPFSGQNNAVSFDSGIPLTAGKEYTLSYTIWGFQTSGTLPTLAAYFYGTRSDETTPIAWGPVSGAPIPAGTPTRYSHTFTSLHTTNGAGARLVLAISPTFTGSWITITDVKLEEGNKATAWTPHREELTAGSKVIINEREVAVSTPSFKIDIGSDDDPDVIIDETGAAFKTLNVPNMAQIYTGPTSIVISATSGNSLKTVFDELNDKILLQNVTITLDTNDTSSGSIYLHGVGGTGQITISGAISGGSSVYGAGGRTVTRPVTVASCSARVIFEDITFNYQGGTILTGTTDSFLRCTRCLFNGGNGSSILAVFNNGANVTLYSCLFTSNNGATLMQANYNVDLLIHGCKGGSSGNFISTNGANVKVYSSRPFGNWARAAASITAPSDITTVTVNNTGYSGGGSSPIDPPAADPTTTTFSTTAKAGYGTGIGWSTTATRHGIFDGVSYVGGLWFDLSSVSGSSRTIKSASLILERNAAGSDSSNVRLKTINRTASNYSSVNPNNNSYMINDYEKIGVTRRQKSVEISLPVGVINDIRNNNYGLLLYVNDSEQMSGKQYSANYASYKTATLSVTYT